MEKAKSWSAPLYTHTHTTDLPVGIFSVPEATTLEHRHLMHPVCPLLPPPPPPQSTVAMRRQWTESKWAMSNMRGLSRSKFNQWTNRQTAVVHHLKRPICIIVIRSHRKSNTQKYQGIDKAKATLDNTKYCFFQYCLLLLLSCTNRKKIAKMVNSHGTSLKEREVQAQSSCSCGGGVGR